MTSLNDVLEDVRRITAATEVPLLVDIDTGWGGVFNIARTIRDMTAAVRKAALKIRPRKSVVATVPIKPSYPLLKWSIALRQL